jgi:hypothetical protein
MTGITRTQKQQSGFAVLQLLIVLAIAVAVAAIALPVYASKAKDVVLQQSARNLELQVKSCLALGLSPEFVPDGDADADDDCVSAALSGTLRSGTRSAGRYVNPLSGSTAIVCQPEAPCASADSRPAVWITDDICDAFADSGRANVDLAGTILVVFDHDQDGTNAIEVFYVDRSGHRSADVATLIP